MRSLLLPLVLLASTACFLLVAGDTSVSTPDGYRVDFEGNSGGIKLYPANAADSKFIKIKWDKIQEIDPQGGVVQRVNNFASQQFIWVVDQVVYPNGGSPVNATRATLTATLNLQGKQTSPLFSVAAWVFQSEVTVRNGNESVIVPRNNVKFSIRVQQWPFESTANRLSFGADVNTPGNSAASMEDESRITFGSDAHLVIQNTAVVDGVQRDIEASTYTQGTKTGVEWIFPSFTQSLDYDPTIGFDSSAASTSFSLVTLVALACWAIVAQRQ